MDPKETVGLIAFLCDELRASMGQQGYTYQALLSFAQQVMAVMVETQHSGRE